MVWLLVMTMAIGCGTVHTFPCAPSPLARAPRNFGVIAGIDGPVYRGGQPTACDELAFLKSIGVKSILKLNDREPLEIERARELGMRVEFIPFDPRRIGTAGTCPDVQRALAFLRDRANWPVYIHCTAGKDRTGYIAGLLELALAVPTADVMRELHAYGHHRWRSVLFPQIDRELASERPVCLAPCVLCVSVSLW